MGVKLFLYELYRSHLTSNKESTIKPGNKGKKRNKRLHPETSIPYSSVLMNQRGTLLVAKSFIESPCIVNEMASQTVLPSTSGKDMKSSKDTHPAPSQGDESKSEPDQ